MKTPISMIFSICLSFTFITSYGQVDTAKKLVENGNSVADNRLKKEIQQKQLLQKPVPLHSNTSTTSIKKDTVKTKKVKKTHRKKKRASAS